MPRNHLFASFALLCLINAACRPSLALYERGQSLAVLQGGLGINPVVWVACLLGFLALFKNKEDAVATRRDQTALIVCGCMLVLPITVASWAALFMAMIWATYSRKNSSNNSGYVILAAVGIREPLTAVGLKLFSEPVLSFDATLAALLLSIFVPDVGFQGNIIFRDDGHRLLVMTGCASYTNLSFAFLAWFSVTRFQIKDWSRRYAVHATTLAVTLLAINISRLAAMAVPPDLYKYFHDGAGAALVAFITVATVALATIWTGRYAHST